MGLNWKLVAGKALGTMAEREEEYRKFATDYFMKKYETRAEEKRAWSEKTREQKREVQKKIDALRAEGLNDTQIANGLNTYGENFFAVVADDLSNYKKSDNYKFLMRQDPTGAKFRDFYKDRFNNLIQTESQQGLKLDPVVQGLMDKFPEMTETPEIAQSIFGFDYTKGIRDDIKGLSKDTNVPDYDAPAGLTGVSGILSGTIRDVSGTGTFGTAPRLNKEIVNRLRQFSAFGDLRTTVDGERFETAGEKDSKKIALANRAATAQNAILQEFERRRASTAPASMEGGKTDQEILDEIMGEKNWSSATSTGGEDGDKGDQGDAGTSTVDFGNNVTAFTSNNPQSPVTKLISELQAIDGVDDTVLQNVLSAIASGKPIRSAIRGLNITGSTLNRINSYINNLDQDDKDAISQLGTVQTPPPDDQGSAEKEAGEMPEGNVVAKPKGFGAMLWDKIFGQYFNPDGSPAQAITKDLYDQLVREYEQALIDKQSQDQTGDVTA